MDCCKCENIGNHFDSKKAGEKLTSYRKNGPQKTTRTLVEALVSEGVIGTVLLDIGGGIGAIQHELLDKGVDSAINLEASSAYLDACKQEADRRGHAHRITHLHGDCASMDDIPEADIVTLERVICCYPDMPKLVSQSCAQTKRLLGLVYPHEAWWVKLGMEILYNLRFIIVGDSFRVFLHPTEDVEALVQSYGLTRCFYRKVGPWQVVVYRRNIQ